MTEPAGFNRRRMLTAAGASVATVAGAGFLRYWKRQPPVVFAARQERYDASLGSTILDGLLAVGVDPQALCHKRVLLKPNLVEPIRSAPHMTTHPAVVLAVAEVFRRFGALVDVGEASGHVRDTELALVESGLGEALAGERLRFADLNYEPSLWKPNRGRRTRLKGFWFPQSVVSADLVVSLPKLKTHHWAGMTASLKNMYGVLPGLRYGWPKNVLHHAGIPESVVDINATLPPTIAVIDAVECMEGDGPILGTRKHLGAILVSNDPMAVDATCARIMGLAPERIPYLAVAEGRLGTTRERAIEQRGEPWRELASPFTLLAEPHLERLRALDSAVRSS